MSRLSRANLKARESVFAGGPELYRGDNLAICPPALYDCVAAFEGCMEEAYEAQMLLRNGTNDLPRMTRVLESQRVFTLVNESTIKQYKAALIDEVEPAINEMISLAENGLQSLVKKENQLRARVEAAEARGRPEEGKTMAAQKLEQRRLNGLIKQRERLESELRQLEAEVEEMESNSH